MIKDLSILSQISIDNMTSKELEVYSQMIKYYKIHSKDQLIHWLAYDYMLKDKQLRKRDLTFKKK
jgi:hypothetical protein